MIALIGGIIRQAALDANKIAACDVTDVITAQQFLDNANITAQLQQRIIDAVMREDGVKRGQKLRETKPRKRSKAARLAA